jgi:hypothetical protein
LRELDVNSIHSESRPGGLAQEHSVVMSIAGSRQLIVDSTFEATRKAGTGGVRIEETRAARYPLVAQDDQAAHRIARAVQRAATLCGGRHDAF